MMTKKESTKILIFITPGAGAVVLGHGYIGSKNAIFHLFLLCTPDHGSDNLSTQ